MVGNIDIYNFLFQNYITYDSLFALNKKAFYERSNAESVDIYIDMHSLIKSIFKMPINTFRNTNPSAIAASMINLCAHLRNYYYTRHRVWTRFYIVWCTNQPEFVRSILQEYNAHNIMAENVSNLSPIIKESLKLLETLCPYLPDIFFFNGGSHETATVISAIDLMVRGNKQQNEIVPNIIYSKDAFEYLLVKNIPLTFIFRPKKKNGVDCSYMVSKTNMIQSYISNELKQVDYNKASEWNKFEEYLSYSGMKARGVIGILKFKKAIDYMTNGEELFFSNEELSRVDLLRVAFTLSNHISVFNSSIEKIELEKGLINLHSPEDVKRINDIYFQEFPLDLNAL